MLGVFATSTASGFATAVPGGPGFANFAAASLSYDPPGTPPDANSSPPGLFRKAVRGALPLIVPHDTLPGSVKTA